MAEEPDGGDDVVCDGINAVNLDLSTLEVGDRFIVRGDDGEYAIQVIECLSGGPIVVMFDESYGSRKIAQIIGTVPFTSSSLLAREFLHGIIGVGDQEGHMAFFVHGANDGIKECELWHVHDYETQGSE